jgi:hypothetical protein
MHTIITLISFYSLTWIVKESSLLDRPRNWLARHSTFIGRMLLCYACTGFWAGLIIYFLANTTFSWRELLLYGLAGSAVSYIGDIIVQRITRD